MGCAKNTFEAINSISVNLRAGQRPAATRQGFRISSMQEVLDARDRGNHRCDPDERPRPGLFCGHYPIRPVPTSCICGWACPVPLTTTAIPNPAAMSRSSGSTHFPITSTARPGGRHRLSHHWSFPWFRVVRYFIRANLFRSCSFHPASSIMLFRVWGGNVSPGRWKDMVTLPLSRWTYCL